MEEEKIENKIKKECERVKRHLMQKAKKKGIYEDFGQDEIRALKDKYFEYKYKKAYKPIDKLEEWAYNYVG